MRPSPFVVVIGILIAPAGTHVHPPLVITVIAPAGTHVCPPLIVVVVTAVGFRVAIVMLSLLLSFLSSSRNWQGTPSGHRRRHFCVPSSSLSSTRLPYCRRHFHPSVTRLRSFPRIIIAVRHCRHRSCHHYLIVVPWAALSGRACDSVQHGFVGAEPPIRMCVDPEIGECTQGTCDSKQNENDGHTHLVLLAGPIMQRK